MNESEVGAEVDSLLEEAGWEVFKTSQSKPTQMGMVGFPDRVCVRRNATVFIELKGKDGVLRDSQLKFKERMRPHIGVNLYYMVIYHPLQIPPWMRVPIGHALENLGR